MKNSVIFISIILLLTGIYFTVRLFTDLPPKINPDIDYFKTKTLKEFSKKESFRMAKAHKESSYSERICFSKYLKARDAEIFKYCIDNNLAEGIGGGCYHFMGTYNQNDMFNALKYCKITY